MRISERWLREWVEVAATTRQIAERLVMAGLELEIEPVLAQPLDGVVVGRIESLAPHPQADKLRVAQVEVGGGEKLQIVCGAANARAGMLAPVARVGATLPGGVAIGQAKLRGVDSAGMLCSARELGLAEKSEGLLELDPQAVAGMPLAQHLALDDQVLALEITPNRGDCLSVHGLAREVAALYGAELRRPPVRAAAVGIADQVGVRIERGEDCPGYAGRVIAGLDPHARTPDWMREKLRRSGLRSIHPVVDVTNYVLLELGQPMHAFDAARLHGGVQVRRARAGEKLVLLNQQAIELHAADLLIADDRAPLALAGVMGGAASEVTPATTSVFLESACFAPAAVAGAGRRHKLASDAAYRFERGVDPAIQRDSLERATELLLQICGGQAGPVTHAGRVQPEPVRVSLRHARLGALLGYEIAIDQAEHLLRRLQIAARRAPGGVLECTVPSYRYDLRLEVDLVEEVARLHGYERIPSRPYAAQFAPADAPEARRREDDARALFVARGWQEAVTYSFVDSRLQESLTPEAGAIRLDNPIADTMAVMRTTLWSGLIPAWQYNLQRQHKRVRLFEIAVCFRRCDGVLEQAQKIAGIAAGAALPEQWDAPARPVDFFDVKGELQAWLGEGFAWERAHHAALHPGQSARILRGDRPIGWLGRLHPGIGAQLDVPELPLLFELDWAGVADRQLPRAGSLSEFPSSRRDLSPVVAETVAADAVLAAVRAAAGPRLREVRVLSVYRGEALGSGFKSIALGLIFQDNSRTLTDKDVDAAVQAVVERLQQEFAATIRS